MNSSAPTQPAALAELSFTVSGRVSRPRSRVYEAVADPAQLSAYFTTGGARGRLEPGSDVTWDFADFPGAFPVDVLEADPPRRFVIQWGAEEGTTDAGTTRVVFEFESLDDDTRTLVTITETSWRPTSAGAAAAFGNCEGWTGMLAALKVWIEHGINLREGFYR
ncbi:MAG: SRPBCC domain-containing protein [Tessaracoccus sp.]|uniref:SRPBCC domain-containing protein n=1 Tax=Tessaracoccus sp. TaxID=1971211 RepID=UPI001ED36E68|nr:SRPBCC domain-containing protein [Tessaracoccus sp.]MBK7820514.1 SRPBCC domain-containing protein [Tessaracoccus sp.]